MSTTDNGGSSAAQTPAGARREVVILVHGIRDHALWQGKIRPTLKEAGFAVEPTNYGRFNIFQFLMPIPLFRRWAIRQVWEQIRIIKADYPDAQLSVIAHSFGTYVVSHLIKRNFDFNAHRIIFCGSVVSYRFRYQEYKSRFAPPILNEVGTRDIWPAMAQNVTWGYGSAGSYGFHRPLVHDRWHNGARHGHFLTSEFCQKFWIPFLKDGTIVDADEQPENAGLVLRILSMVKIKYVALAVLAFAVHSYAITAYGSVRHQLRMAWGREQTPQEKWQTWPWPEPGAACLSPSGRLEAASCGNGAYVVVRVPWDDTNHGLYVREEPRVRPKNQNGLLAPNETGIDLVEKSCQQVPDQGEWCELRCLSKKLTGYVNKRYLSPKSNVVRSVTGLPQNWDLPVNNGPSLGCQRVGTIPSSSTDVITHHCQASPNDPSHNWCLVTYQSLSGWVPEENLSKTQNTKSK